VVVGHHGVQVEGLRIGEVGVGDGSGYGGPVGGEPAAEAVGVVASAEVLVAGFGIAHLAFELEYCAVGPSIAAVTLEICGPAPRGFVQNRQNSA